MVKAKRTTKDPWKAKEWYAIHASPSFNNVLIGNTPASDPALLIGRVVKTSLSEITGERRDFKKQKQSLSFRITEVKGQEATSEFIGNSITRDYARSMGKRGSGKFYGSFVINTEDAKSIKVKITGISSKKLSHEQRAEISNITLKILQADAKEKTLPDFVQNILFGKLGSKMFTSANKVYPMKFMAVTKTEVVA